MSYEQFAENGLILSSRVRPMLTDQRAIRRDVDAGNLVRLRRGAYVAADTWQAASPRERHILRIRSVVAVARRTPIVAGFSAAALWGMPIAGGWPTEVTLLDDWLGGGRSEPGVRRTAAGKRTARTTTVLGMRATTLARTAIDVARSQPISDAIGSVDWSLWRRNPRAISFEELLGELALVDRRAGRRHLERVVGLSTHLSDSFGESECRAVIETLGFERPELQTRFVDSEGEMFPDFFWRRVGIAAEFDGKMKYTRHEYTAGDPAEVVWREKRREDRLRRQTNGVIRILSSHVKRPQGLEALLIEAGIPRRGGR